MNCRLLNPWAWLNIGLSASIEAVVVSARAETRLCRAAGRILDGTLHVLEEYPPESSSDRAILLLVLLADEWQKLLRVALFEPDEDGVLHHHIVTESAGLV